MNQKEENINSMIKYKFGIIRFWCKSALPYLPLIYPRDSHVLTLTFILLNRRNTTPMPDTAYATFSKKKKTHMKKPLDLEKEMKMGHRNEKLSYIVTDTRT